MSPDEDDAATSARQQHRIDAIVARGPRGAVAVAGVAVFVVVLLWVLFYVFAYLPRGVMQ